MGVRSLYAVLFQALAFIIAPMGAQAKPVTLDIEVDPFAYMLNGYSLHLGLSPSFSRFDLGVFGLEMPEAYTGNENIKVTMRGYGAKYDFTPVTQEGFFVGIEGGVTNLTFTHKSVGTTKTISDAGGGIRFGYRILASHVTFTPWIGIGYYPKAEDILIDGEKVKREKLVPFPTMHVGYFF